MLEIERKFLVKHIPEQLDQFSKEEILQGYYKDSSQKTIRLRKTIINKWGKKYTKYYLTQKKGKWLVRQELEKTVSEDFFSTHRKLVENNFLTKTRYKIPYQKYIIELDEYHEKLQGLWTVEVEFWSLEECTAFTPLPRFGEDISKEKIANNRYLSTYGMNDLIKKMKSENILIKQQLKHFYDSEAKKYAQTRKKHRSDAEAIVTAINNIDKTELKILEVGCGSGRLLEHLGHLNNKKIDYTWVDLSGELIKRSEKIQVPTNITTQFICKDMLEYLPTLPQESYDLVIGIASIQHLPSVKERFLAFKFIYRILKYEGIVITTNRSISQWFIKTHRRTILKASWQYIISRGKTKRNDLLIPWKSWETIFYRFYHLFTIRELKDIGSRSGFSLKKCCYLNKQGQETPSRKKSNNTLLILQKAIFK